MRIFRLVQFFLILIFPFGCREAPPDYRNFFQNILIQYQDGNFKKTRELTDSLKAICSDSSLINQADSLCEIADRISLDFSFDEKRIDSLIVRNIGDYSDEQKVKWENNNWLEYRIINGKKRYFNRSVSNLSLLKSFYINRALRDSIRAVEPEIVYRRKHTAGIIRAFMNGNNPVGVVVTINYTLTVDADAVPPGETVRCWLPYPKENHSRQRNVNLISASDGNFVISPDTFVHRTIYMESVAQKGTPVIFNVKYSFRSSGQYCDPKSMIRLPYMTKSDIYRKYTSEQPPQIRFSEEVRALADSIAGDEKDPYAIVRKMYYWFNRNIPWAGALEYSTMPDIPGYVIKNKRGDCGMQTMLLMSLLRYKGVPVRWQSGWMIPQDYENLHDWCEVYFEGTGWVPVDVSYGLQYSTDKKIKEFYISGIDAYRLIVNDGIGGALYPAKKYMRSEPYDFQRGEVEWEGGNLYFDKWDYNIEITYDK